MEQYFWPDFEKYEKDLIVDFYPLYKLDIFDREISLKVKEQINGEGSSMHLKSGSKLFGHFSLEVEAIITYVG